MTEPVTDPLDYYATPGLMTEPREHAALFDDLPTDIPALCRVIQGVMIHTFWAERYGIQLSEARQQEVNLRSVARKLARIQELDARPLTAARPLDQRLVGNCRDFAVLLTAMLRHRRVPARARCGFSRYFMPGQYEDHWVCEYWNATEKRWVLADAQLDEFQIQALRLRFDPCDVPRTMFLSGGAAWQMCRAGRANPDKFGIFDMHGMWFIRGNVVRDLAALNKIELLPWDGWGLIDKERRGGVAPPRGEGGVTPPLLTPDEIALLDRVAELTHADVPEFAAVRSLYENDARLRVPPVIRRKY